MHHIASSTTTTIATCPEKMSLYVSTSASNTLMLEMFHHFALVYFFMGKPLSFIPGVYGNLFFLSSIFLEGNTYILNTFELM